MASGSLVIATGCGEVHEGVAKATANVICYGQCH
jgi:hypothetical protein